MDYIIYMEVDIYFIVVLGLGVQMFFLIKVFINFVGNLWVCILIGI